MSYIPAFGLAARFTHTACGFVIGMDLHRKLFMRKEKFHQQREATGIGCGFAHKLLSILGAQLRQRLSPQRPIRDFAVVSGQPRLLRSSRRSDDWDKWGTDQSCPKDAGRIQATLIVDKDHSCGGIVARNSTSQKRPGTSVVSCQFPVLRNDGTGLHSAARNFRIRSRPRSSSATDVA